LTIINENNGFWMNGPNGISENENKNYTVTIFCIRRSKEEAPE
jgi:hypothetical protein